MKNIYRKESRDRFGVLLIMFIWAALIFGWVVNIVKLYSMVSEPVTGVFVLRVIGIFIAPLGSVMGFL